VGNRFVMFHLKMGESRGLPVQRNP